MITSLSPMVLQKQSTKDSCLPTAFAMALGMDAAEFTSRLAGNSALYCIPEMTAACYELGYAVIEWPERTEIFRNGDHTFTYHLPIKEIAKGRVGVLINDNHAVAWDGERIFNPSGHIAQWTDDYVICLTGGDFGIFYEIAQIKIK